MALTDNQSLCCPSCYDDGVEQVADVLILEGKEIVGELWTQTSIMSPLKRLK